MELDELRKKIDDVDNRIVDLLNERYRTVMEIGAVKKSKAGEIYVPEREKAVYEKVAARNHGPMKAETLHAVYCEIMSGALSLESTLKVAYPEDGAMAACLAALSKFGHSVGYLPESSVADVFRAVLDGEADYGCVSADCAIPDTLRVRAEINPDVHDAAGSVRTARYLIIGRA